MLKLRYLPKTGIAPREFCRICFDIASLSPIDIADYETESDYRQKCIRLLAETLGLQECTIRAWGRDLNFQKMPDYHKLTLAYALQAAQLEQKPERRAA